MMKLNDGRDELWQWDTGRKLTVDADCSEVHFSNRVYGRSVDVPVVDGIAKIPDVLLQMDNDLYAWGFVGTPEDGYTKISKVLHINRRNKPADYVFTPPEQTTLDEILGRINAFEQEEPERITTAIEQYITDNPITAADVNAVPQNQGGENAGKFMGVNESGEVVPVDAPSGGSGTDISLGISGASAGQIAKIKAVDASGAPTEWETEKDTTPFIVTVGGDNVNGYTSSHTFDEIAAAAIAGRVVMAYTDYIDFPDVNQSLYGTYFDLISTQDVAQFRYTDGLLEYFVIVSPSETSASAGYLSATSSSFGGIKADSAEATDTQPVRIGEDGKLYTTPGSGGGADISLDITGATVGQIARITAVDDAGIPTAWEAVDMTSGSGDNWKLLVDFESTEEIAANTGMVFDTADDGTPINAKEIIIDWYCPAAGGAAYATFKVNNVKCTGYAHSNLYYFWSGGLLNTVNIAAALHFMALRDVCLLTIGKKPDALEPVWFAETGAFETITSLQLTMFGGTYPVGLKIKILGR